MPLYLKIALPVAGLILCVFAVRADQLRCVPDPVNTEPTLPTSAPFIHNGPV